MPRNMLTEVFLASHTIQSNLQEVSSIPKLSLYSIITPLKYVFENIVENGAFSPKEQMLHFQLYFQKYSKFYLNFFNVV